jgi:hypothetical protein
VWTWPDMKVRDYRGWSTMNGRCTYSVNSSLCNLKQCRRCIVGRQKFRCSQKGPSGVVGGADLPLSLKCRCDLRQASERRSMSSINTIHQFYSNNCMIIEVLQYLLADTACLFLVKSETKPRRLSGSSVSNSCIDSEPSCAIRGIL